MKALPSDPHVIVSIGPERFAIPAGLSEAIESSLDLRSESGLLFFGDAPVFDLRPALGGEASSSGAVLLLKSGFGLLCSEISTVGDLPGSVPLEPFWGNPLLSGAAPDGDGSIWILDEGRLAFWGKALRSGAGLPFRAPASRTPPFPRKASVATRPVESLSSPLKFWSFSLEGFSEVRWALSPREISHLLSEALPIPIPGACGPFRHGAWIEGAFIPVWLGESAPKARVYALAASRDASGRRRELIIPLSSVPEMASVSAVEPMPERIIPDAWRPFSRSGFWLGDAPVLAFAPDALFLETPSPS